MKKLAQNNSGFSSIFLLLILPTLVALLALVYQIIFLFEFRNEFRFRCINESLYLLQTAQTDQAEILLRNLSGIKTPIHFEASLFRNPNTETETLNTTSQTLVYLLKYTWLTDFEMKCGASKSLKDKKWQYEIIYTTDKARF